jgi:predicted ATPase
MALDCLRHALEIQRRTSDRAAHRSTLCSLGDLQRDTGHRDVAPESYQWALVISRELGDRHGAAKLLGRLADMWFAMGRTAGARELLHEAHAILVELNDPEADLVGERVNAKESIVPTPTRR